MERRREGVDEVAVENREVVVDGRAVADLGEALAHGEDHGFSLFTKTGVEVVYLYFQIPLMILVIAPALEEISQGLVSYERTADGIK